MWALFGLSAVAGPDAAALVTATIVVSTPTAHLRHHRFMSPLPPSRFAAGRGRAVRRIVKTSSPRVSPALQASGKRAVVGVLSRVPALVLGRDRSPPPRDPADNCAGASALARVATDRTDGSAERGPAQAAIIVRVGHPRRAVVGISLRTAT